MGPRLSDEEKRRKRRRRTRNLEGRGAARRVLISWAPSPPRSRASPRAPEVFPGSEERRFSLPPAAETCTPGVLKSLGSREEGFKRKEEGKKHPLRAT